MRPKIAISMILRVWFKWIVHIFDAFVNANLSGKRKLKWQKNKNMQFLSCRQFLVHGKFSSTIFVVPISTISIRQYTFLFIFFFFLYLLCALCILGLGNVSPKRNKSLRSQLYDTDEWTHIYFQLHRKIQSPNWTRLNLIRKQGIKNKREKSAHENISHLQQ